MKRTRSDDDFIDDFGSKWRKLNNNEAWQPGSSDDSDSEGTGSSSQDTGSSDNSDSEDSEDSLDPTAIVGGARIQINAVGQIRNIRYIGGDPVYTPASRAGAGGRHSSVVLGPGGYTSTNSKADRNAIPAITQAETFYNRQFKAGHLLNEEFGGSGSDGDNLTILSNAANSAMRAFDEAIKRSVQTTLLTAYTCANNVGIDVANLDYGIQLDITTDEPNFWSNAAGHAGYVITTGVLGVATIVGEPVLANLETDLTNQYGAARVHNHANLMAQLAAAITALQNEVVVANAVGMIPNN